MRRESRKAGIWHLLVSFGVLSPAPKLELFLKGCFSRVSVCYGKVKIMDLRAMGKWEKEAVGSREVTEYQA